MNNNGVLKSTSLLSLVLLTLHLTDDIVRGISKAQSSNTALVILVVFLYGTLVLADHRRLAPGGALGAPRPSAATAG